ncbi:MAG: class II fructose-bisphosphate aldolase [Candidatus Liptonbacteria bacterium]|nr:class II fructose-bisphosphate aldolase [Candidatus Liptonbacteria bacterium]
MKTLKEYLREAEAKKTAIGHFNISELTALKAIVEAARETGAPVLIGVSEGEREFIGVKQVVALIKSLREEYDIPLFLNADHTHSLEKIKEAAEAGFDEVIFDGSALSLEENIAETKKAVEIAKSINPEIVVEGEIGYIGSSSEIIKDDKDAERIAMSLTTPEEAEKFVKETGIDVLAPAVGNRHGLLPAMARGEMFKRLDIARIKTIKEAVKIPLTLHGGSGTADEDFVSAIEAGMAIVHVSTELRIAWRKGVESGLKDKPDEVAPYKILPPAVSAIKEVVLGRLKLFNQ